MVFGLMITNIYPVRNRGNFIDDQLYISQDIWMANSVMKKLEASD